MICHMCGAPGRVTDHAKLTGRAYCSTACSKAYRARVSSETMARTNRKYASERMTRNNPMRKPEARAKMRATLAEIGHAPKIRGGNGKPPTMAEVFLLMLFGDLGFELQLSIKTGFRLGTTEYPPAYKVDIGNRALKVAVEADGMSHCSLKRQAQDAKKDAFLRGIGWTVLRFSNSEILSNPMQVFETVMSTTSKLKASTLTP